MCKHTVNTVCVLFTCSQEGELLLTNSELFKKFFSETFEFMTIKQGRDEKEVIASLAHALFELYNEHPEDIPAEIRKEIKEFLERNEKKSDLPPVIKTTTRKPDTVILERSKAGRKLQDKNELDNLFGEGGIIFPTYEYKTIRIQNENGH